MMSTLRLGLLATLVLAIGPAQGELQVDGLTVPGPATPHAGCKTHRPSLQMPIQGVSRKLALARPETGEGALPTGHLASASSRTLASVGGAGADGMFRPRIQEETRVLRQERKIGASRRRLLLVEGVVRGRTGGLDGGGGDDVGHARVVRTKRCDMGGAAHLRARRSGCRGTVQRPADGVCLGSGAGARPLPVSPLSRLAQNDEELALGDDDADVGSALSDEERETTDSADGARATAAAQAAADALNAARAAVVGSAEAGGEGAGTGSNDEGPDFDALEVQVGWAGTVPRGTPFVGAR